MEAQATRPDPWTPERMRLRAWFHEYAPRLEAPYEAAVRLLHEPSFPARGHLLSHLVREIANGLPQAVTGRKFERFESTKALDELAAAWHDEVPERSPFEEPLEPPAHAVTVSPPLFARIERLVHNHERVQQTQQDKTALLMDELRPGSLALRPALEPVIREWAKVVRWFQEHTHLRRDAEALPADDTEGQRQAEAELQRQFRHFEDGLHGILAGHFEVTHEIDAILASSPPGAETLKRLMPLLGGAQQILHFFERIDDPAWLEPLERGGFFERPPEPIHDESRGTVAQWSWPAGRYLKRVAAVPEAQEAVVRIAAGIETDNVRAHDDIGDIALALPPRLAAQLADVLVRALSTLSGLSFLDQKAAALTERLAAAGERAPAQQLLKALVEVVPDAAKETPPFSPTPRTRVDHHALAHLFDRHLPGIVAGLGVDALGILCSALARAMRLSGHGDPNESIEDHSDIWRPAIEHDNRGDARDVLVTAVRRAAELLASTDQNLTPAVLDRLERRRWMVFRRIALHVIRSLPTPSADLVAARLLDRQLFDHFTTCREYRMLLQRCFGLLAEEQQRKWLGWVDAGRPAEEVRDCLERWSESAATVDAIAKDQRWWQWHWLGPAADSLPRSWRARFDALVQEFGPPKPPEQFDSPWTGISVGWERPLSIEQARAMTPPELAAFCRKPLPERPLVSSEGLGEAVSIVVKESPERYANDAIAFRDLAPTYVRAVFNGLVAAVSEKRPFPWDAVFRLAEWVLTQPVVEPEPTWDGTQDSGWGWTRGTITRLLSEALKHEPSPLPADMRDTVWSLLAVLCADPSPQRRGDALEASVRYAEWVRVSAGQPWAGSGTLDDVPELRRVIEAAVDLSTSPVPRVYEAIGHQLPWLIAMDETWVQAHLPQIFPAAIEHADLWQAAWRAYLHAGVAKLYDRVFIALAGVYADAIARLSPEEDKTTTALNAAERALAEHLAVFYGRGTLERQGVTDLLDRFFERASLGLRRHLLWHVGHSLDEETQRLPPEVAQRFQHLWQKRRDLAASRPDIRAELPAFGMWFGCRVFDADWRLAQLEFVLQACGNVDHDHRVAEHLAELAEQKTAAVVRCCALAIKHMTDQQSAYGWTDQGHIKTILAAALRRGDPAAQAQAIETFHRLGSLGFRRHELLPFSDDLDDPATIAYFTWDHPMTVAEIRKRLTEASEPERNRMLGQILREAKDTDVWKFTTPEEVVQRWPQVERHLGKRRAFWTSLLGAWKEQGLLAE